jgi:WD40 repeat protein
MSPRYVKVDFCMGWFCIEKFYSPLAHLYRKMHSRKSIYFHPIYVVFQFLNINNNSGIDHHRTQPNFATSSIQIDLWDHSRADPILSLSWGAETITTVKFNQTETSLLASAGTDRTVILYDIRTSVPISKSVLAVRSFFFWIFWIFL